MAMKGRSVRSAPNRSFSEPTFGEDGHRSAVTAGDVYCIRRHFDGVRVGIGSSKARG